MSATVPEKRWVRLVAVLERALPLAAGIGFASARGGQISTATVAAAIGLALLSGLALRSPQRAPVEAAVGGVLPVIAGVLLSGTPSSVLLDPALVALVIAFVAYGVTRSIVAAPSAQSTTALRLLHTAAIVALAIPVVIGELHWAIAILPFAVFRIALGMAERVRPGEDYVDARAEAADVATRMLWMAGVWIAGWTGVGR